MIHSIRLGFAVTNKKEFKIYNKIINEHYTKKEIESYDMKNKKVDLGGKNYLIICPDYKFVSIKILDVGEFINKKEVENKDYKIFEKKLNSLLSAYKLNLDMLKVYNIDYKLDLHLAEDERQEYLYVLSKMRKKYYSIKKKVYRNKNIIESVYYKGSQYGFNINNYDKNLQMIRRDDYKPHLNDVLRIELQLKKLQLKQYCKKNDLTQELINLWHTSVREEFFNNILIEKFIYSGDHYNINNIHNKLNDIKASTKDKIIKFCKDIIRSDIDYAKNKVSTNTSKNYIQSLQNNNINPIPTKTLEKINGIETILRQLKEELDNLKQAN